MRTAVLLLALLLLAPTPGVAQETPRMGGVLKVATIGEPPTLDVPMSTAAITYEIMWHVNETLFTYDARLQPGAAPGGDARGHRRRPAPHHHAAQRGQVPQRQGDDLRRRGALAQALGAGGLAWQVAVGQRGEHRGQGCLHGRALAQAALGLAAVRARRAARRRLPQGSHRGGRRRPAQGVHRHRPVPVRRAQARPSSEARPVQGLRRAQRAGQRFRGQAGGVLRRDPVHPGARHGGAAGRRGDRRVPPRHVREAGLLRSDQVPAPARVADRQAARLGGGRAEPQGRRHDGQEGAAGVPGRAGHGADHDRRLRQQGPSTGSTPACSSPNSRGTPRRAPRSTTSTTREKAKRLLKEAGYARQPVRWATTREYEFMYKNAEVAKQQLEQVGLHRRPPGGRLGHAEQPRAKARAVGRGLDRPRVHRRPGQPHRVPLQLVGQLVQRGEGAAPGRARARERREEAQGAGGADPGHLLRGRRPR